MIKIKSLHKYFNRGKQNEIHVLNNISLDLPERGMVAIFGRSGCGKTTLLNVIGGLDSFLSGSVEINGEKINSNNDALRNKHIGYIFQNYNLSTGETCFDNVADALRLCGMSDRHNADEIRERTMAALSAVGLAQYARRYPDTLSGGQKQRIAIARAIVKSPDIILADEPTGNLDETNTVMIMDILREIAKTRLVLLVTHEANLVDSYCDRVIGITDGRITSQKENDIGENYAVKNKNHIYLGEFEKSSNDAGAIGIDYYGEPAEGGIKLTVVNDGGKLFLRVDTPGVHIIDEYGETKLHDGVFEQKEASEKPKSFDLSRLSAFEGKRYGRLFGFFSSLKSGSRILRGKKMRRGKQVLKTSNLLASSYLICFALVFTILLSYCASGIALYDSIGDSQNLNMFYISVNAVDSDALAAAIYDEAACIDFIQQTGRYRNGDVIRISTGMFETFSGSGSDAYRADTVYLTHDLIGDSRVLAGSTDQLGAYDIVLSDKTADAILKTGTFDYISTYEDLINCNLNRSAYYLPTGETHSFRVAAVVESGELAAYADAKTLASSSLNSDNYLCVYPASSYGTKLERGQALIGTNILDVNYLPKKGETIKINGKSLTAAGVYGQDGGNMSYDQWLRHEDIVLPDDDLGYYEDLERRYSHMHDYAVYLLMTGYSQEWSAYHLFGGSEDALHVGIGNEEYYAACKYREANGAFPAERLGFEEIKKYRASFEALTEECIDFYSFGRYESSVGYYPTAVLVSDEDYAGIMFGFGETHPAAISDYYYNQQSVPGSSARGYVKLHSTDPERTEAFLRYAFPELPENNGNYSMRTFVTPSQILEDAIEASREEIIASAVALCVGLVLMCICIYFTMRSSMLSKVREIGIYRAIGVSKKNLLFKFAVESTAIALQTLVIGFAAGAYFASSLAGGGVTGSTFYFPFWLASLTFILLIGTCVLFGVIPIASLLRKTPAQILAKYDI